MAKSSLDRAAAAAPPPSPSPEQAAAAPTTETPPSQNNNLAVDPNLVVACPRGRRTTCPFSYALFYAARIFPRLDEDTRACAALALRHLMVWGDQHKLRHYRWVHKNKDALGKGLVDLLKWSKHYGDLRSCLPPLDQEPGEHPPQFDGGRWEDVVDILFREVTAIVETLGATPDDPPAVTLAIDLAMDTVELELGHKLSGTNEGHILLASGLAHFLTIMVLYPEDAQAEENQGDATFSAEGADMPPPPPPEEKPGATAGGSLASLLGVQGPAQETAHQQQEKMPAHAAETFRDNMGLTNVDDAQRKGAVAQALARPAPAP